MAFVPFTFFIKLQEQIYKLKESQLRAAVCLFQSNMKSTLTKVFITRFNQQPFAAIYINRLSIVYTRLFRQQVAEDKTRCGSRSAHMCVFHLCFSFLVCRKCVSAAPKMAVEKICESFTFDCDVSGTNRTHTHAYQTQTAHIRRAYITMEMKRWRQTGPHLCEGKKKVCKRDERKDVSSISQFRIIINRYGWQLLKYLWTFCALCQSHRRCTTDSQWQGKKKE